MEQPRNAAFARRRDDGLGAAAIDGMKILLARHPHAGPPGKMVNLIDVMKRAVHRVGVEHRAFDLVCLGCGAARRTQVEHPRRAAARDQRRDQMLPDEAAAAGDKSARHDSCYGRSGADGGAC